MEINSSNHIPHDANRRPQAKSASKANTTPIEIDRFVGPNVDQKLKNLAQTDGSRADLIARIQKEFREGTYLTDERIQNTIDQILSSL